MPIRVGMDVLQSTYGVREEKLRMFLHYQPQFYHLHVHFTSGDHDWGMPPERCLFLDDVIQNLELDSLYYSKRTMLCRLREQEGLARKMKECLGGESSSK
jgi:m7GpppX diphosphatase